MTWNCDIRAVVFSTKLWNLNSGKKGQFKLVCRNDSCDYVVPLLLVNKGLIKRVWVIEKEMVEKDLAFNGIQASLSQSFKLHTVYSAIMAFHNIRIFSGVPGEPIAVSSEEDIFDIIGMDYKTPEQRSV